MLAAIRSVELMIAATVQGIKSDVDLKAQHKITIDTNLDATCLSNLHFGLNLPDHNLD